MVHPSPLPSCPFIARALFPFSAENSAELTLQQGDLIHVVTVDDAGWWEGRCNAKKGLFPANYVELLSQEESNHMIDMHILSPALVPISPTSATSTVTSPVSGSGPASTVTSRTNSLHNASQRRSPSPGGVNDLSTTDCSQLSIESQQIAHFKPTHHLPGQRTKVSQRDKNAALRKIVVRAPTQFGQWAWNMSMIVGCASCAFGLFGILWRLNDPDRHGIFTFAAGVYSISCGMLMILIEYFFGRSRTPRLFPSRGLAYFVLSVFYFFGLPTAIPGFGCIATGFVNCVACYKREHYEIPKKKEAGKKKDGAPTADGAAHMDEDSMVDNVTQYFSLLKQQNKAGTIIFLFLYICCNFIQYGYTLNKWLIANAQLKDDADGKQLSDWGPWAKGFGGCLDLNCALIVVPVLRTILRSLYNKSTADQGWVSTALRTMLYIIPLDHNLMFHKLIAKVIVLCVCGHVGVHFINLSLSWDATIELFGISPWFTGAMILFCMLLLYSAVLPNVKQHQFEIFWYCHHSFVPFFFILLLHGKGVLNPNYWKYFALPGTLYFLERSLRAYRAYQDVCVLSITLMNDVFSIEFGKTGVFAQRYKEGQYIFLQCPAISTIEWHPFTISSAPEEKSVTVHIRIQGENSWTRRTADFLGAMGAKDRSYFQLSRHGPNGMLPGKLVGPTGVPLLRIDGPHSAPTQHIGEYDTVVVVGAGIGATPVSSAIKSIVFHKWRLFMGACFPDNAYFMWVCAHRDINAFRWLIRIIKDAQDEVIHMRASNPANMSSKQFQFHIFVTSVPKDQLPTQEQQDARAQGKLSPELDMLIDDEIGFWGLPAEDAMVNKVRADWDEADLYTCMQRPAKHTQLGDIHVWEGRPAWGPRFAEISAKHPTGDIGVTFCGSQMIAKDLKKMCHKMNRTRGKSTDKSLDPVKGQELNDDARANEVGLFKLHKENLLVRVRVCAAATRDVNWQKQQSCVELQQDLSRKFFADIEFCFFSIVACFACSCS